MLGELRVSGLPDGKIMADALKDFAGQPKKFTEIAPLVYREVDGQDKIAFKHDASGRLQVAIDYLDLSPSHRRLRTWARAICALNILFVTLLAVVLSSGDGATGLNGIDGRLHALQALEVIAAVGSIVVVLNAFRAWLWRPAMISILAAGASRSGTTSSSLSSGATSEPQGRASRTLETLIALACLGFTWFVLYWNILNFSLHY
jgi:hypothetical protein